MREIGKVAHRVTRILSVALPSGYHPERKNDKTEDLIAILFESKTASVRSADFSQLFDDMASSVRSADFSQLFDDMAQPWMVHINLACIIHDYLREVLRLHPKSLPKAGEGL